MPTGYDPLQTPIDKILLAYGPPNGQQVAWQRSPGVAKLPDGASSPRRWDQRQGYGLSGAFPIFFGNKLAEFDIQITLYTSQDWADWASWSQLVAKAPEGTRPKALSCYHPWLAEHSISALVVKDLKGPVEVENGGFLWTIECMAWRKPKIALSKPEAAKTNTSNDPVDKWIEQLTGQVQELSK